MDSFFDSNLSDGSSVEEKIRNLTEKIIKNPEDYISYKEQARLLLNNNPNEGRAKIALESLKKFLDKEPEDIEANCLVVRALRLQGSLDDALSMAERLKTKFQNTAIIYEELGRIQIQKENYDAAYEILSSSYRKYNNDRIGRAFTYVLLVLKKKEQALTVCNNLLNKKPDDAKTVFMKISILCLSEKYNEAIELGEIFIDEYPKISNEIIYQNFKDPVTFEILLSRIYQSVGISMLKSEKSRHLYVSKNNNEFVVKKDISLKIKKLFEKSLFHIDNSISDRSEYDWSKALSIKQKSLTWLGQFEESLVVLDELLQNKRDYDLIREKIFVLFCLKRYSEVLKISEQYLKELPTSKLVRKIRLSTLLNVGKTHEYDNELKQMQAYRKKKDPKKPTQNLIKDEKINYSQDTVTQARDGIRKLEKELKDFLRENLSRKMFIELDELHNTNYYEDLEKRREAKSKLSHQPTGLNDFYQEMDLGTMYFTIIKQRKREAKEKYDGPKSKLSLISKDQINNLEWLRENFRNPHDHSENDIEEEFSDMTIQKIKIFIHEIRAAISNLKHI